MKQLYKKKKQQQQTKAIVTSYTSFIVQHAPPITNLRNARKFQQTCNSFLLLNL
jgi:hypothetical protein